MWYQINHEQNRIVLKISVKPNAKKSEIVGVVNDALKIHLHAPATEGKANAELIHFLKKTFSLKQNDINILRGEKSKTKTIELSFSEQIREFLQNHSK